MCSLVHRFVWTLLLQAYCDIEVVDGASFTQEDFLIDFLSLQRPVIIKGGLKEKHWDHVRQTFVTQRGGEGERCVCVCVCVCVCLWGRLQQMEGRGAPVCSDLVSSIWSLMKRYLRVRFQTVAGSASLALALQTSLEVSFNGEWVRQYVRVCVCQTDSHRNTQSHMHVSRIWI